MAAARIAVLLTALALIAPVPVGAAVRHAEPGGDGPIASCPQSNPCSLTAALDYYLLADGDEVVVAPGEYSEGAGLGIAAAAFVHGQPGEGRPRILTAGGTGLIVDDPDARLSDLAIEHTGSAAALYMRSGLAERVFVHADSESSACDLLAATLRDSVCWNETGAALRSGTSNPIAAESRLRNVTAVSTGAGPLSYGIRLSGSAGADFSIEGRNVIAAGAAADVAVQGDASAIRTEVKLASSNFDTVAASAGGTATAPDSGDNRAEPARFVDAVGGDFRPVPGSPTIDAGTVDDLTGGLDLSGAPRSMGEAIDVGAFEHEPLVEEPPGPDDDPGVPGGSRPTGSSGESTWSPNPGGDAPAASPPRTRVLHAPKRRSRARKALFRLGAIGAVTGFQCRLDRAGYRPCGRRFSLAVKPGRHRLLVRAVGPGGVDPTPAVVRWWVRR